MYLYEDCALPDYSYMREWAQKEYSAGDEIVGYFDTNAIHPASRAECAKINATDGRCADGTSRQGSFSMPYAVLVNIIGQPNGMNDGYKTDVEWIFKFGEPSISGGKSNSVATIYNWKNGPNYTGGGSIEDIDEWNVGGHDDSAIAELRWIIQYDHIGLVIDQ